MSIDRLPVGSRSVLAIRVRRLELEISSCRVLGDLHKFHGPFTVLHLHAFASDRIFELQSFPLQSDVDFAPREVLAGTLCRHIQLSARKVNHSRPTIFCFTHAATGPCPRFVSIIQIIYNYR